jgi:beta-phosphoglucomutase-like phosphatase (HAD superfamily)
LFGNVCPKVGICSASSRASFNKIAEAVVGPERLHKLDVVIAGDDVSKKKPDPMIYNEARARVGIPAERYFLTSVVLMFLMKVLKGVL